MLNSFVLRHFFLAELGCIHQHLGEDLDTCEEVMRQAIDCCDPVEERMTVNVCLHDMMEEYLIFLDTYPSLLIFKLMETARRTNESVLPSSMS